jgi:stage V sporulation protein G
MPAKKMKDGTYRDLAHPLDKNTRQMIEQEVMFEFKKVFEKSGDLSAF